MPDEPGVGLEHVRMMPLEESTPVPRGAGASAGALHDSGPTPASIARVSRDSITMRSVEARGGFLVFRRFTGLLLGRPLRRGHIASLGIHRRKGSHFRQKIGSEWDFHRRWRGIESAWQPRERALPRPMRARRRGSGLPMATKTADQTLGQSPIARRSTRRHPPEARTMATIPARTASGSRYQTAASSATSVGIASGSMRFPCRSAVAVATPSPERAGGQTASPFASPSRRP